MEKFKAFVYTVDIPDKIAIEALRNILYLHSKFRDNLYRNPASSLQDVIEEDTKAILSKQNTTSNKPAPTKSNDARSEPRQHSSGPPPDKKKNYLYIVNEDAVPASAVVVQEKERNHWDHDTSDKPMTDGSSSSSELEKFCDYHKIKGHDYRECRHLYEALLESWGKGVVKVEPPKPKPKSGKNWTKNKEKSGARALTDGHPVETRPVNDQPAAADQNDNPEEEQPKGRQCIQVIFSTTNANLENKMESSDSANIVRQMIGNRRVNHLPGTTRVASGTRLG